MTMNPKGLFGSCDAPYPRKACAQCVEVPPLRKFTGDAIYAKTLVANSMSRCDGIVDAKVVSDDHPGLMAKPTSVIVSPPHPASMWLTVEVR